MVRMGRMPMQRRMPGFQSCIGRAFPSLTGSAGALLEGRMYIADRRNIEALRDIHNRDAKMGSGTRRDVAAS